MQQTEYAAQDGLALAELIAARAVTAAELLAVARERARAVNPRVNAIVRWMDGIAEERAAEPLSGPFAGVPFLLKDLGQEYAGLASASGCRALAWTPAPEHATVVRRWLDAGLVVFGKTNTPEFGAKGITEAELYGPARNPWDLTRTPGGSSGGAAAAVAAGVIPVAGASDGGGSIRIPAACCGLFGLKAGRGLVPSGPAASESLHGAATDGVISRSVRDSAAMLDLLAGAEPASAFAPARLERPLREEVGREPGRLRIGFLSQSVVNPQPHRQSVTAVEDAAKLLEQLGHAVEPVATPYDDAALARDFLQLWFVYVAYQVEQVKQLTGAGDDGFEQDTLIMAALGRRLSGVEHCAALERRHEHVAALARFHEQYDLLLTPTLAEPPPKVGAFDTPRALRPFASLLLKTNSAGVLARLGIVDRMIDENLGWVPFTQLANLTGRPAMSVPLHWTPEGLPLGVQVVAPLGGEGTLVRLAAQLEQARPWTDRRPSL
ncbi:amidase [Conexibacter stalactiti]|uniref:Amidase n=1 Tax=Conexibacter stalactiti TaxID=1940611 RepID=A0ABU4HSU0_9ACTN|nr:amidase [Conexibacter stalactiti]MDW5595595.1 amidase [Conexibacter stalactiti]MEC5036237.1 amidase [Conexibacter stalactiti]